MRLMENMLHLRPGMPSANSLPCVDQYVITSLIDDLECSFELVSWNAKVHSAGLHSFQRAVRPNVPWYLDMAWLTNSALD
jgi:hypothetical protein